MVDETKKIIGVVVIFMIIIGGSFLYSNWLAGIGWSTALVMYARLRMSSGKLF